jgi:Protocatechuate 3,4-dioxygenase beta subunit
MDNDDIQIGTLLSRREALTLLGLTGAAFLTHPAGVLSSSGRIRDAQPNLPGCIVRPEETEGPYFVDEKLNRSDISTDPSDGTTVAGSPLLLAFVVSRISGGACAPLAGAQVDVWQCNAAGVYSDVKDPAFNTIGKKFLRGNQVTGTSGHAIFKTIYPGWYEGRAVHIHFKIRAAEIATAKVFTSQLYFNDALTDEVHKAAPYVKPGKRTRNEADAIYNDGTGKQLMLPVRPDDIHGYSGVFRIALKI